MTVIPVGYAQATWLWSGSDLPYGAATTLGLDVGTFAGTPDELAELCWLSMSGNIVGNLPSGVQLIGCEVKYGPNDLGPTGIHTETSTGGDTDDASPSNVTWLIRKQTAAGGRPNRGRMYMPGLAEGEVDGAGVIDPAKVAVFQSGVDDFGAQLAIGLVDPVVLHSAGSPVVTPTLITSLVVDGRAATQRRRLRR